jgi:antitoxin component HigA of HigAB toxin-antitoxin module
MTTEKLSATLRRFIHSIPSIPQLEAMILLHHERDTIWDSHSLAKRLYLTDENAKKVLDDLCAIGICEILTDAPERFKYNSSSEEMDQLLRQLAQYYSTNLIEVTDIIHSKANAGNRAKQFADAFRFKKED